MSETSTPNHRHSIRELLDTARGRWIEILDAAGIPENMLDGRGYPCPNCGGRNRFAAFPHIALRGAVHCRHCFTRGSEPRPGDGLATIRWRLHMDTPAAMNWLAVQLGMEDGERCKPPKRKPCVRIPVSSIEQEADGKLPAKVLRRFAEKCYHAFSEEDSNCLAARLGVRGCDLRELGVGYSDEHHATTWPMFNAFDQIVGIRLRSVRNDSKFALRGGRAGLFIPEGVCPPLRRLFIAEGPTDTAALLSLRLPAIGRPSCSGSVPQTAQFVGRLCCRDVVIVADHDEAGIAGAESLAKVLVATAQTVRIIQPGKKGSDVREWVRNGANAEDIERLVGVAKRQTLSISREVKQRRKGRRR